MTDPVYWDVTYDDIICRHFHPSRGFDRSHKEVLVYSHLLAGSISGSITSRIQNTISSAVSLLHRDSLDYSGYNSHNSRSDFQLYWANINIHCIFSHGRMVI